MKILRSASVVGVLLAIVSPLVAEPGHVTQDERTQGASPATPPSGVSKPPERSEAGSWQGTWYFIDRSSRLAFWFDAKKGRVKSRYRYELTAGSYGDSGESGTGPSTSKAGVGTLSLTARLDKDDVIRGKIVRVWTHGEAKVTESNDFEAYRTGGGVQMYCRFYNFLHEEDEAGKKSREAREDYAFNFTKATDELVFWEELPFGL